MRSVLLNILVVASLWNTQSAFPYFQIGLFNLIVDSHHMFDHDRILVSMQADGQIVLSHSHSSDRDQRHKQPHNSHHDHSFICVFCPIFDAHRPFQISELFPGKFVLVDHQFHLHPTFSRLHLFEMLRPPIA